MYFLYRILTAISALLLTPYYAVRARRRGESTRSIPERLGRVNLASQRGPGPAVWIHAVSVGEVLAAQPLIQGLKERCPNSEILVSTTTETGQALARERLSAADRIFYFPFDWVQAVRRALRSIRPAIVIVMETEIWPNFLQEAKRAGVPVVFANARISDRSIGRFRRWRWAIDTLFAQAMRNASLFLAQCAEDAGRLVEMGADDTKVIVTGNLKYDMGPPPIGKFALWLGRQISEQERWPVLVAGSVLAQEEDAVLAAYDYVQRKFRRTLLVLAPRRPDRFQAAADAANTGGWKAVRRSALNLGEALPDDADILVLDSIGELAGVYSLANTVFVGGSLVTAGGHNILEPASFAKPPVFGPSMDNFREMANQFLDAKAGVQVANGPQLGKVWLQLIENANLSRQMGQAALEICERNRGATARSLNLIVAFLDGQQERK